MYPDNPYIIYIDYDNIFHKGEPKMNNTSKKFWMITGDQNSPKVRHANLASAQAEATRLARAYPGTEFFVLEAVELVHQPSGVQRQRL